MFTRRGALLGLLAVLVLVPGLFAQDDFNSIIEKKGIEIDMRSSGRMIASDLATNGFALTPDTPGPITGITTVPQIQLRGFNVQANSPDLDNFFSLAGFRTFLNVTQSETSIAARGRNIVATYNTSAGQEFLFIYPYLYRTKLLLSGYSTSNDGGQSWTSGFFPGMPGSYFTYGDPVVGVDRLGNFYFAGMGTNAAGLFTIQVNKSGDGGRTFADAVLVQQDDAADKEWLAVGPDPVVKNRDNVYVTWTSFRSGGTQLRFGRSTDGGATFTAKTIYVAEDKYPLYPSLQFSNPYVDPITGVLYVPFMHSGYTDQDYLRILVSHDAGETFSFLNFNFPGVSDPTALPILQPGDLNECGATKSGTRYSINARPSIHAGANVGGSRSGLPRWIYASRLTEQPTFAARNGVLFLAFNNNNGTTYGDGSLGSSIVFLRSDDGGATWTEPIRVNPDNDPQHVFPSLSLDTDANDVHIAYYTQHGDGSLDVDIANSHDRGNSFAANRVARVTSTSFALPPTNVPLPSASQPYATTNYDRTITQCYALGEYLSATSANGTTYVLWGDGRNQVTHPVNSLDPLSGQTHSQMDVFFQAVKAQ